MIFEPGDRVEKIGGGFGGPGEVVCKFELAPGVRRYVVKHSIEGGWGTLLEIYAEAQLAAPKPRPTG